MRTLSVLLALGASLALPSAASAFGPPPLPISVGPDGQGANAISGGAAVSGDNRKTRLSAFHSDASNLIAGDTNEGSDIFVWVRPTGEAGLSLSTPGTGRLVRASVNGADAEANGPSYNPSLDGSIHGGPPHCVAFESRASNLHPSDSDQVSDIFVRDLESKRTYLVSRGVTTDATTPAIDGDCRRVVFEAGGRVILASVRSGSPRAIGTGTDADIGIDGSAMTWVGRSGVMLRRWGRTVRVAGAGLRPEVSNRFPNRTWNVVFDTESRLLRLDRNPGRDVYRRYYGTRGGLRKTQLVSATRTGGGSKGGHNENSGTSVQEGSVFFTQTSGGRSQVWLHNYDSGNVSQQVFADAPGNVPSITGTVQAARGTFIAFSATGQVCARTGCRPDRNGPTQDVFMKHLSNGDVLR